MGNTDAKINIVQSEYREFITCCFDYEEQQYKNNKQIFAVNHFDFNFTDVKYIELQNIKNHLVYKSQVPQSVKTIIIHNTLNELNCFDIFPDFVDKLCVYNLRSCSYNVSQLIDLRKFIIVIKFDTEFFRYFSSVEEYNEYIPHPKYGKMKRKHKITGNLPYDCKIIVFFTRHVPDTEWTNDYNYKFFNNFIKDL